MAHEIVGRNVKVMEDVRARGRKEHSRKGGIIRKGLFRITTYETLMVRKQITNSHALPLSPSLTPGQMMTPQL